MGQIVINTHIIADPAICHGKPVFKGTRIMVWQVLELLEAGQKYKDIKRAYPHLSRAAVNAALRYAADKVKETSYVPFQSEYHSSRYISTR